MGEGEAYKPWLRVQDVNSRGHSGKIYGIKTHRQHHTLSEHETCFFYLAEFNVCVCDIREQFPLLPLDLSVKIAKTIGVKHPSVPRKDTCNIMTTDFVLTCFDGERTWYEAISVKPQEELKNKRVAEKLDIERIWWQLQGIRFQVFAMTAQNKIQSRNIQWITAPIRQGCDSPQSMLSHALSLVSVGIILIEDLCNVFINDMKIDQDKALIIIKLLIYKKNNCR
ncbi:TnsA endonuclease N-terminal domain-containing protein [Rahnella variigena]|uniref:TnsA endonuclease N-terminal domain-containing protein n=1 Tax=Rahnella variigena TaxID=574964 RepID=UPI003CF4E157